MSEQINKVLASHAQAFDSAEQLQARTNIGAQATLSYGYDTGGNVTSIDGTPLAGGISDVKHDSNMSGSGTVASPLGLASSVTLSSGPSWYPATTLTPGSINVSSTLWPTIQVKRDASSYVTIGQYYVSVMHSASGVGGGATQSTYGEGINLNYNAGSYWLKHVATTESGLATWSNGNTSRRATLGFGSAAFTDDGGETWETVDPTSIRLWNSYTQSTVDHDNNFTGDGTSGSPLGLASSIKVENSLSATRMGPAYVSAASHVGTAFLGPGFLDVGDIAYHRSAYLNGAGLEFNDNGNTAKVSPSSIARWNAQNCYMMLCKPVDAIQYLTTADYPSAATAYGVPAMLTIVNYGAGPTVVYPDSDGATGSISTRGSAVLVWDSGDGWKSLSF